MTQHNKGTREEWLSARKELLEREKELTRQSDGLARQRRALPAGRLPKLGQIGLSRRRDGPLSSRRQYRGQQHIDPTPRRRRCSGLPRRDCRHREAAERAVARYDGSIAA